MNEGNSIQVQILVLQMVLKVSAILVGCSLYALSMSLQQQVHENISLMNIAGPGVHEGPKSHAVVFV